MSIQPGIDFEVIRDALEFAKNRILGYYTEWSNNVDDLIRADVDRKRAKSHERLKVVFRTIENPEDPVFLFTQHPDRDWIFDIIRSALYIFSLALEKAVDPDLPVSELRLKRAQVMVEHPLFRESKTDLYLKEYGGYKKDITPDKKLLFFSYSSEDKKKVGKICDILEKDFNYNVFKAHETIKVAREWRDKIKENLDNCDGLVAYITRKFRGSEWTYQECGWVACRGIPIYPLLIMKKIPDGFIEERQGSRITEETDAREIATKINEAFE